MCWSQYWCEMNVCGVRPRKSRERKSKNELSWWQISQCGIRNLSRLRTKKNIDSSVKGKEKLVLQSGVVHGSERLESPRRVVFRIEMMNNGSEGKARTRGRADIQRWARVASGWRVPTSTCMYPMDHGDDVMRRVRIKWSCGWGNGGSERYGMDTDMEKMSVGEKCGCERDSCRWYMERVRSIYESWECECRSNARLTEVENCNEARPARREVRSSDRQFNK